MICKHCGAQIPDGTRFCAHCGAAAQPEAPAAAPVQQVVPAAAPEVAAAAEPVAEAAEPVVEAAPVQQAAAPAVEAAEPVVAAAPVQQAAAPSQYSQYRAAAPEPAPFRDDDPVPGAVKPKKKKKKGKKALWIILGVAAALLIAAGIYFRDVVSEFFLYTFSSPEKYYQHVEDNAIDKLAEQVGDAYANYKENLDADKGTQMSLRIDPAIDKIDALESAADYLSWLDYITLDSTIQREDDRMAVDVALGVNGTELATADVYKDDELSAVCVPMVSESYMLFDLKTTNSGVMEVLNVIASADLSRDEVVNLIAKLLKAVTHELDSVDKERDSLEAQDVSQHCMVLHVTVTPKDKQQIVDAVKKVLQTDKGAKKIISALAEQTGEDEQDILDRIADFDPDIDEDGKLKMDVFVGLNGDIVGRTIKSDDSSLRYAAPVSFIKRVKGLEVEARSNDEAVFRAEGTLRADSGELKFFGAPEEGEDLEKLLEVEYSDLKIKGDDRSGSFEFKLGKGVSMFLRSNGSEISVPLDTVSGKGKFSGDKKSMESSLTLRLAETEIAKLSYEQKQTDKASVEAVTKTITAAQWQRQFDPTELIGTLISRLSDAGMPEDVMVDFLTNVVGIPRSAAKALIRQAA